jgi:hypothetical protein
LRGTQGLQYWLYSRAGADIILGIEPSGNIATITAQGSYSPQIYTSRGIGLGDDYFSLISSYGYPESNVPISEGLKIAYPEQDVTFILKNLHITEISIGQPPALPATATAQTSTARRGGGRVGMPGPGGRIPPAFRR